MSLLIALRWVKYLKNENVDFKLDSKKVVDQFHQNNNNVSEFGAIIIECRQLFSSFFRNFDVEFIRRQTNKIAYALAKTATFLISVHLFIEIPTCIQHLIINAICYKKFNVKKKIFLILVNSTFTLLVSLNKQNFIPF
jgi:hypothetical protein